MSTLLLGPNFSGRSEWLAERRRPNPWPQTAMLGPFPDLACSGLASTVEEELAVAALCRSPGREVPSDLKSQLGLEELLGHELHALSGGESVRVALSSVAAQDVDELHIDTSLEQLDEHWRRSILALLAAPSSQIAKKRFIVDNHLSQGEMGLFDDALNFPMHREESDRWSKAIDPAGAAAHILVTRAATISVEHLSFSYTRRSPTILHQVSLSLHPGTLYIFSGQNGSGKTTFVKLLSGTLLPRTGAIRYGSAQFRPAKSPDRFASLAFQNPDFQWTAQTVGGELQKAQGENHPLSIIQELLPTFGIPGELFKAHPHELLFVLKKRLGIALAALAGKPWLIFDEPTLGQDEQFRVALAEFIRLALAKGAGVLLISHDVWFRSLFPAAKRLLFGNQTIVPAGE